MAFFSPPPQQTSRVFDSLIPKCGECGLFKGCISPKMPLTGEGRKGALVIAEAPGAQEDQDNTQLVGKAGQTLRSILNSIGVDLDRDCWKTNSIICRPEDNRSPSSNEIDYCRPNLFREIRDLNPRVIIPMGAAAVYSLLGSLWRSDVGAIGRWVGWKIPDQQLNAWICPTWHPSYVLRTEEERNGPVVKLWFQRHLEQAFGLGGRPWVVGPPEFEKEVRIVIDPYEAADWIREKLDEGGLFSFDYETDRLKPDAEESGIVSCAICWKGKETIAYPWTGNAIEATRDFLVSDAPKIGANCKFEDRWSRKELGVSVRNWVWDGMVNAHALDTRPGITSVKFQAYIRLGQKPWGEHIKPYLESSESNTRNRIREVNLRDLLLYNGLDALMEFHIAVSQRKELENGRE